MNTEWKYDHLPYCYLHNAPCCHLHNHNKVCLFELVESHKRFEMNCTMNDPEKENKNYIKFQYAKHKTVTLILSLTFLQITKLTGCNILIKIRKIPYRPKHCRSKIFVGQYFHHLQKFSSLCVNEKLSGWLVTHI